MKTEMGTMRWARRAGGRLSRRDRTVFIANGLRWRLEQLPAALRRRLARGAAATFDLDALVPPDSRVAREAERVCEEACSPALRNHCYRTYLWGCVLGATDGIEHDDELLYVASLLHDLGLTERYAGAAPNGVCHPYHSAYAAREVAVGAGWSPGRGEVAADAIVLHMNGRVGLEHGPEAYLLAAGAAIDVVGTRYADVPSVTREAVLARHPRLGLKHEFAALWREHGLEKGSRGRVAWLAGAGRQIARSPFAE